MILRPLRDRATYLTWAWLIVGGALVMPYMMAGQVIAVSWRREALSFISVDLVVFAAAIPVVWLTGLVLPVRALETVAARSLLGLGDGALTTSRWRVAAWFTLHLGVGGFLSGVTLALVPYAVMLAVTPFLGDLAVRTGLAETFAWTHGLGYLVAPLILVALVYGIALAGTMLRPLAARTLAPTPAERLAAAEAAAHRLTEHNRLARELHDSIGHALSVVTVQAAAAKRVIGTDPDFARTAMGAVEQTARVALADLDHVLGVLRDGEKSATAPRVGLEGLPGLAASAGVPVAYVLDGDLTTVPAVVSREAYRIAQEGVTNAARYGDGGEVALSVRVTRAALDLSVGNTVGPGAARPGGGRGLAGVRERAATLGGTVRAGAEDGRWELAVRLPLA
ncbi:histidine kinase [Actinorhabdospora filicis]|uniref:histidine kinase n=1 Tax=Actinorhabdospora filicis TaxID=1785913 RepID=A0A9W6WA47_9ACTN|nr:histidine kinase [Actinorhabdospora filicis]GLZ79279.1 histidine kinase [Actinorhabdospora filicis]